MTTIQAVQNHAAVLKKTVSVSIGIRVFFHQFSLLSPEIFSFFLSLFIYLSPVYFFFLSLSLAKLLSERAYIRDERWFFRWMTLRTRTGRRSQALLKRLRSQPKMILLWKLTEETTSITWRRFLSSLLFNFRLLCARIKTVVGESELPQKLLLSAPFPSYQTKSKSTSGLSW